jgi:hypothetical protein
MTKSRLKKVGAIAGIAFPIIQMIAQALPVSSLPSALVTISR